MKDPAFLFYPGDYLQDTQSLPEQAQVAYDRIMCEHMRNICISQRQLDFFTKKLSDYEKEALMLTLTEVDDGYQIQWVADSIRKRREYSESRRNNRKGITKKETKKTQKHMLSYDNDMVNEIENENINRNNEGGVGETEVFDIEEIPESPADIKYENLHDGSAQACLRKRYGRHSGDAAFTVLENMNGWPEYMTKRKINAFDRWIQNLHERGNSLTKFQFDQELSKFKNWSDVQAEENCGHSLCYPQIYEKQKQPVNGQSGHQISDGFKARYGLQ